ncbi:MAG: sigma-54 dependent transcriptional regulator [Candidatus Cloacimonetes bacterium]|jgi:DNA-binding NtrC family response regulator|nr:sigma-54 dependent transcriptional regulator [Candidatus Cloacimonadota bacterium]
MHLLLVEDNQNQREILAGFLSKNGFDVISAEDGEAGIRLFKENLVDIVITDFRMPRKNGLEVLQAIRRINPLAAVIIITAFSDVNDAVSVIKEGAMDYILKPINLQELLTKIKAIRSQIKVEKESSSVMDKIPQLNISETFIGKSKKIMDVLSIVQRVADKSATMLISGESGTGKEMIAEMIHSLSPRRNNKLVIVSCAALPDNLLESELFGHLRGSFTGATSDRKGRFEEADGGTIFLDEIGDISPLIQVKLLRVVQNMTFEPVGSSRSKTVDVRIIAATNKNLSDEVSTGNFREDLYYRLNVVPLHLPPLRERKVDIPLLIEHFLTDLKVKDKISFSAEALLKMVSFNWPGNIRQLQNTVTRLVTLTRSDLITLEDLTLALPDPKLGSADDQSLVGREKDHIKNILDDCNGNQVKAAKMLGIHRNTLARKIKEFNL